MGRDHESMDAPGAVELVVRQMSYLRRQRLWTQQQMAERTGIRQPEISRIEAGLTAPTVRTISRLAEPLGYRAVLIKVPDVEGSVRVGSEVEAVSNVDWQTRIWSEPNRRSGQPTIRGMRITVRDILEYLAGGMSVREVLDDFPELEEQDISAALAYAAAHLEPMPVR
jgi:uncharacterized protein (DUF433 family)